MTFIIAIGGFCFVLIALAGIFRALDVLWDRQDKEKLRDNILDFWVKTSELEFGEQLHRALEARYARMRSLRKQFIKLFWIFCAVVAISAAASSPFRTDMASAISRARDRAREAAANALDQICTNSINQAIAGAACTRVNRVVNTSAFFIVAPIYGFPPTGMTWNAVKYIGHGLGTASAMNLCVILEDLSMDVSESASDGVCWLSNTVFSAEARARARCAVVCSSQ